MKPSAATLLDIEDPRHGVEIQIRGDGKVVWVNVDGRCLLRVCMIPGDCPVSVIDERLTAHDQAH